MAKDGKSEWINHSIDVNSNTFVLRRQLAISSEGFEALRLKISMSSGAKIQENEKISKTIKDPVKKNILEIEQINCHN